MSRIVLLALDDEDVDVLSRLARMQPRPEAVVVHPQAEALVVRLAELGGWPVARKAPEPRADDLLIVSSSQAPAAAYAWERLGATIVAASAFASESPAPVPVHAMAQAVAMESAAPRVAELIESDVVEPFALAEDGGAHSPTQGESMSVRSEESAAVSRTPRSEPPAALPADFWASPEATFRYLVEHTLGAEAQVSLWWSGGTDVWVPWTWTGEPPAVGAKLTNAVRVPLPWGEACVLGQGADRLSEPALRRVVEDIALRDVMRWRETAQNIARHGAPSANADPGQLAAWLDAIWDVLEVQAALVWRRTGDGWSLVNARGSGLSVSGAFNMPEALLAATFEHASTPWSRWDPVSALRLHVKQSSDDRRLPLRLRRITLALTDKDSAR